MLFSPREDRVIPIVKANVKLGSIDLCKVNVF